MADAAHSELLEYPLYTIRRWSVSPSLAYRAIILTLIVTLIGQEVKARQPTSSEQAGHQHNNPRGLLRVLQDSPGERRKTKWVN
jgi:hypothetical protein